MIYTQIVVLLVLIATYFIAIGLAVPAKKIFKRFLPYMDMAAILVIWPDLFIITLVPPSYRYFL